MHLSPSQMSFESLADTHSSLDETFQLNPKRLFYSEAMLRDELQLMHDTNTNLILLCEKLQGQNHALHEACDGICADCKPKVTLLHKQQHQGVRGQEERLRQLLSASKEESTYLREMLMKGKKGHEQMTYKRLGLPQIDGSKIRKTFREMGVKIKSIREMMRGRM